MEGAAAGGEGDAVVVGGESDLSDAVEFSENWPDALAASALDRPSLLSGSAALHPATRRFVQRCPGSIDIVILLETPTPP